MAGSWFDGGGSGNAVDVAALLAETKVWAGIAEMVEAGSLVSMGTTSDGGALGITVTVNGRWRREYVRSGDELLAYIAEAVPAVTDELAAEGRRPARSDASDAPRGRTRRPRTR
jgi:hypothetical protein